MIVFLYASTEYEVKLTISLDYSIQFMAVLSLTNAVLKCSFESFPSKYQKQNEVRSDVQKLFLTDKYIILNNFH
jgi:hypothetical protein